MAKLPDSVPLTHGVVLPLALNTAIVGMFEMMRLRLPGLESKASSETILLWGASSSVGSVAIQLAVAAGYDVITTASQRNHQYAKELGATEMYDYTRPHVVEMIKQSLQGKKFLDAFDWIGEESGTRACAEIMSASGGGLLPGVLWPLKDLPENVEAKICILCLCHLAGTMDRSLTSC